MPPFTATPACPAAPSQSEPLSGQATTSGSKSKTTADHGPRPPVTPHATTDSTSSASSPTNGASTTTTRLAPSGQDSTGPASRSSAPRFVRITLDYSAGGEEFLHSQ